MKDVHLQAELLGQQCDFEPPACPADVRPEVQLAAGSADFANTMSPLAETWQQLRGMQWVVTFCAALVSSECRMNFQSYTCSGEQS